MLNPSFIMEQGTAAASANYVKIPVFGFMQLTGSQNEIQMRQFNKQLLSQTLSHTAHYTDDKIGMFVFEFFHVTDFAFCFSFCGIADTAGVEKQHIGIVFTLCKSVTALYEQCPNSFGVPFIHLAAVGFYKYFHDSSSTMLLR